MPRVVTKAVGGTNYYLASEAAKVAGISKPTLLRWINEQRVQDAAKRDRNGWRLFSEAEVRAITRLAQRVEGQP